MDTLDKKILVIGRSSFLAQRWCESSRFANNIEAIPFAELEDKVDLDRYSIAINFAQHTDSFVRLLNRSELPATKIADKLSSLEIQLIQLSSRRVYGMTKGIKVDESAALQPACLAGRNKVLAENVLKRALETRLTVLRMSNVFGLETDFSRLTFFTWILKRLVHRRSLVLDFSGRTKRDFLPVASFCKVLDQIVESPTSGTFNVGSGIGCPIKDIISKTAEGFGGAELIDEQTATFDEFTLDVRKLRKTYDLEISIESILASCYEVGRRLKSSGIADDLDRRIGRFE
jgi:nucleoside-diphosphate-sugar epimerase